MRRVMIIGSVGVGKSTLGTALGAALGLPVIHLDLLVWQPGCQTIPDDEFIPIHRELLAREVWLIEGVGPWQTWDERAAVADTIVLPDYSLWQAWRWTLRRQVGYALGRRPISPPDCPLLWMTWKMLHWIWIYHREMRPAIMTLADRERTRGKTILHWRTPEEMRRFLRGLQRPTAPAAP
jgi:adenylate kinase family enzyme